jgi:hypothetical protein
MKKDKQEKQPDNAELQNKLSEKQHPSDTDKGGLSDKERANVVTQGNVDRQSVGEAGNQGRTPQARTDRSRVEEQEKRMDKRQDKKQKS